MAGLKDFWRVSGAVQDAVRPAVLPESSRGTGRNATHSPALDDDQAQLRCYPLEIVRIAGSYDLPGPSRANGDMGIHDVGRPGFRQQKANSRRVGRVKPDQIRTGLSNQPGEAGLFGGAADSLGESGGRHRHPHPTLHRLRNQYNDTTIVPVQRDQSTGVQSDTAHAAVRLLERFFGDSGERIP